MHAFPDIHAVTKPSPFPAVAAAMASPHFRSVKHIFDKAGLDPESLFISNGGPLTVADLDAHLAKLHRGLSSVDRISLKSTLARLGLLVE